MNTQKSVRALVIFILYLISNEAICQIKVIELKDEKGNPVEFANIYAPNSSYGVVSNIDGIARVDLGKIASSDTIQISCIGYEDKFLSKRELQQETGSQIILKNKMYDLDEVAINTKIKYKKKTLGTRTMLDLCQSGFIVNGNASGWENGVVIRDSEGCTLETINFNLAYSSHDSMRYEINLYKYDDKVLEPINRERIFIMIRKNKSRNQIDLKDRNIYIEGDFLVSFEAVDVREDNWSISFKSKCFDNKELLSKEPNGKWKKNREMALSIWCQMKCLKE